MGKNKNEKNSGNADMFDMDQFLEGMRPLHIAFLKNKGFDCDTIQGLLAATSWLNKTAATNLFIGEPSKEDECDEVDSFVGEMRREALACSVAAELTSHLDGLIGGDDVNERVGLSVTIPSENRESAVNVFITATDYVGVTKENIPNEICLLTINGRNLFDLSFPEPEEEPAKLIGYITEKGGDRLAKNGECVQLYSGGDVYVLPAEVSWRFCS